MKLCGLTGGGMSPYGQPQPHDYESGALPAELIQLSNMGYDTIFPPGCQDGAAYFPGKSSRLSLLLRRVPFSLAGQSKDIVCAGIVISGQLDQRPEGEVTNSLFIPAVDLPLSLVRIDSQVFESLQQHHTSLPGRNFTPLLPSRQ